MCVAGYGLISNKQDTAHEETLSCMGRGRFLDMRRASP
ncbi:hypothetical protein HMPREF9969_2105 [Prevotella sp. oral taxon 306 str. F0472]|nr:hypothetical protein HMPREF9969_2105 [Prevotella sp. oral taxon 306 str. F0472]